MQEQPFTTTISFAETAVSIQTTSLNIHHLLQTHLHHCQAEQHPPKTTYNIETIKELEPLLQQIIEQLIIDNKTHVILHGGAVSLLGKGIILCGASGSGKSTLTTWLVKQGATYLTDEVVAFTLGSNEMTGFSRPIILKNGSAFVWEKWLSTQQAEQVLHLPVGIHWLAPDILEATIQQQPIKPSFILFPTFDAQIDLEIRPLTTAQTAFTLMQHLVNARNLPRHGIDTVKAITAATKGFAVRYNDASFVQQWLNEQIK